MITGEWPLLFFTLAVQLAIGTWIVTLSFKKLIACKVNEDVAAKLTASATMSVGPIMIVALLVSFFHLGHPILAYGAIANISSSWLSREILFSGLFMALWMAAYYLNFIRAKAANLVAWLTFAVGFLAVFSMASIYHFSSIPAWSSINTYVVFFATTLILGGATTSALVCLSTKNELGADVIKLLQKLAMIMLVATVIQLASMAFNIIDLQGGITAARSSAHLMLGTYNMHLVLCGVIGLIGSLLFLIIATRGTNRGSITLPASSICVTFVALLVAETLGRFVFYASAVAIGIG